MMVANQLDDSRAAIMARPETFDRSQFPDAQGLGLRGAHMRMDARRSDRVPACVCGSVA